jgi:hypothetical protein
MIKRKEKIKKNNLYNTFIFQDKSFRSDLVDKIQKIKVTELVKLMRSQMLVRHLLII